MAEAIDPQIEKEVLELREKLARYQKEYYIDSAPSVSDLEYDRLFDRLLELEKEYPVLDAPDSPTKKVGSDLTQDFPLFDHKIPVLSLDKCYTAEELIAWLEKMEKNSEEPLSFVIEEKIDGASIVLYYEKGVLINGVTRGNGAVGNDITGNVKTIKAVPLKLKEPLTLAVRGEIFLPKKEFVHINKTMEIPYANPRNLASGSLRRIKSSEVAAIPLDIFVYEGFFEESLPEHTSILEKLRDLGFKLNHNTYLVSPEKSGSPRSGLYRTYSLEEVKEIVAQETRGRENLEYEIDGLVVKVNNISRREALGYTGHHPRWAIAYKFESPQGETEVEEIKIQIGRTGRVTPVATVKPVEIAGSTISRVTLHNQDYINILELAIGDRVIVEKRGDVIPSVSRVVEHGDNQVWQMPEHCVSCGTKLEARGAHTFCLNRECPEACLGRLTFFSAKKQMDIENLGQETIAYLYENGLLKEIDQIYTFDPALLMGHPGFGEKKIDLIRKGIELSKTRPYKVVLSSLGIPELGPKAAELLIEAGIRDVDTLLEIAAQEDRERLIEIQGIGEKTAATIISELNRKEIRQLIENLKKAGLNFVAGEDPEGLSEEDQIFKDQVWCVTGSFEFFKPRDIAMEEVKKGGGRIVSGITGKTTHLLAGEKAGSKLKKANELGITVLSEEEFIKLLKNPE